MICKRIWHRFTLLALLASSATAFVSKSPRTVALSPTVRYASSPNNNQENNKRLTQKDGVYSRPSAAIERGSGFFIPGLEGPKVRLAGGLVLLALVALVSATGGPPTPGNTFSQGLAAAFSLLVLFQAAVEFQKEQQQQQQVSMVTSPASSSSSPTVVWQQRWSMATPDLDWKKKVEWAASSYLALTPATNMLLVGPGKVLFALGPGELDSNQEAEACMAALETCASSKGGRVALPATHPSASLLPESRSVVLQRVSAESQLCWLVTSDQLLASFTKQDLKWLGRMGEYVVP